LVSGGEWKETPLQIQGTIHFLNRSHPNYLQIGCLNNNIDYWLANFEKIGEENGYTKSQIAEYQKYINLAKELQNG
jgi:hypothetical protein